MNLIQRTAGVLGLAAALALPVLATAQTPPANDATARREAREAEAQRTEARRTEARREMEARRRAAVEHPVVVTHRAHPIEAVANDGVNSARAAGDEIAATVQHPRREVVANRAPGTPVVPPIIGAENERRVEDATHLRRHDTVDRDDRDDHPSTGDRVRHAVVTHEAPGTPTDHPVVGQRTDRRVEADTHATIDSPREAIETHRAPGTPTSPPPIGTANERRANHDARLTVEHPRRAIVTHRAPGTPRDHAIVGERAQ